MKKISSLIVITIISMFMINTNVFATEKNEVILKFDGANIHDGYVEYNDLGTIQLFKDGVLVTDINDDMKIDLSSAKYQLQVKGFVLIEDPDNIYVQNRIAVIINDWYYGLNDGGTQNMGTVDLDSSKYNDTDTLIIKLKKYTGVLVNTRVEKLFDEFTATATIDLSKEYVIDFSKDDDLTKGLKILADLDNTLYYKNDNGCLLSTDNESEAVIKIVGNKAENKAIMTAVNVGNKKSENFKGLYTKYTGSKLNYDGRVAGVINETRTDYYTKFNYDLTFKYVTDESSKIDYKVIEGANQKYIINKSNNAVFRINPEYNLFENVGKVYVDDTLLTEDSYTSKSGSTIITLNDSYLKKLSLGEHTLKVVFTDENEAVTKFTITDDIVIIDEVKPVGEIENPSTGDNIIVDVSIGAISALGLLSIGIFTYRKKQAN